MKEGGLYTCSVTSVMSKSLPPYGLSPAKLLSPWDFPARLLEWVAIHSSKDLPDPGIEPVSPAAPALQEDSLPLRHWVSSRRFICA